MKFYGVLILITSFLAANGGKIAPRIIGGETAESGQFPFSAAINIRTDEGSFFCGGALISNLWILTAGQCVNGATSFQISLGSNNLSTSDSNRLTVTASEFVLHPEFTAQPLSNDIGLIKLPTAVTYNDNIQRVQLGYERAADYSSLTAIGWGQINDSVDNLSEQLQFVTLSPIPSDQCTAIFGNQIDTDEIVCVTGSDNEGTCAGDSGSPLLDYDPVSGSIRHVGIASFFSGNGCSSTDPSGYTITYAYRDWIRDVSRI